MNSNADGLSSHVEFQHEGLGFCGSLGLPRLSVNPSNAWTTLSVAQITIPVIGIGAGNGVDGQILVWTDLAGLGSGRVPKFVKEYAQLRDTLAAAVTAWAADVVTRTFPDDEHSFTD